jgi:hypothetical protein
MRVLVQQTMFSLIVHEALQWPRGLLQGLKPHMVVQHTYQPQQQAQQHRKRPIGDPLFADGWA